MDEPTGAKTGRELVLAFRPEARVETRTNAKGHAEYRVVYNPVPGPRRYPRFGWCPSEGQAWRAARVRLGLRIGRRG